MTQFMTMLDNEDVAPSQGLEISVHEFTSSPDRNTIQIPVHPAGGGRGAALRLLHPRRRDAGHERASTACTRAWGRIIAAQGVAVAMVDFRNCLIALVRTR